MLDQSPQVSTSQRRLPGTASLQQRRRDVFQLPGVDTAGNDLRRERANAGGVQLFSQVLGGSQQQVHLGKGGAAAFIKLAPSFAGHVDFLITEPGLLRVAVQQIPQGAPLLIVELIPQDSQVRVPGDALAGQPGAPQIAVGSGLGVRQLEGSEVRPEPRVPGIGRIEIMGRVDGRDAPLTRLLNQRQTKARQVLKVHQVRAGAFKENAKGLGSTGQLLQFRGVRRFDVRHQPRDPQPPVHLPPQGQVRELNLPHRRK